MFDLQRRAASDIKLSTFLGLDEPASDYFSIFIDVYNIYGKISLTGGNLSAVYFVPMESMVSFEIELESDILDPLYIIDHITGYLRVNVCVMEISKPSLFGGHTDALTDTMRRVLHYSNTNNSQQMPLEVNIQRRTVFKHNLEA